MKRLPTVPEVESASDEALIEMHELMSAIGSNYRLLSSRDEGIVSLCHKADGLRRILWREILERRVNHFIDFRCVMYSMRDAATSEVKALVASLANPNVPLADTECHSGAVLRSNGHPTSNRELQGTVPALARAG